MIFYRHDDGKYIVRSESGRNLGVYPDLDSARRRIQQIEFFKHLGIRQVGALAKKKIATVFSARELSEESFGKAGEKKALLSLYGGGDKAVAGIKAAEKVGLTVATIYLEEVDPDDGPLYSVRFPGGGGAATGRDTQDLIDILQDEGLSDDSIDRLLVFDCSCGRMMFDVAQPGVFGNDVSLFEEGEDVDPGML